MAQLEAHGMAAEPLRGWDGEIYQRTAELPPAVARTALVEVPTPILHLANFALPSSRGDYGGGAVELMGRGGIFIALLEHDPADTQYPLFKGGVPWPLAPGDFDPQQMQRTIAGQAGCQRFFSTADRAFCMYVVLGSYVMRNVLVPEANAALATITLT